MSLGSLKRLQVRTHFNLDEILKDVGVHTIDASRSTNGTGGGAIVEGSYAVYQDLKNDEENDCLHPNGPPCP
jgi:hypothetical protein